MRIGDDMAAFTNKEARSCCRDFTFHGRWCPLVTASYPRSINAALFVTILHANLCQSLGLRNLCRGHVGSEQVARLGHFVVELLRVELRGCEVHPHVGLNVALWHTS